MSKPLVVTAHDQPGGGLTRVSSSEAWTARSEVLKREAPRQPKMHKSNSASHSPQNNPNKHEWQVSLQIWRHVRKCLVRLVPPKTQWDHPTGGRERHATPRAAHTSSGECATRRKKSTKLGGTHTTKQLGTGPPHTAVRRAPIGHTAMHGGTKRCEHCGNHQMRRTPSEPSANKPPPHPPPPLPL